MMNLTRPLLAALAFSPVISHAEITPAEARAALAGSGSGTPFRPGAGTRAEPAPDFSPATRPVATPAPAPAARPAGYWNTDVSGFFGFDAGYALNRGTVQANGARSELAGAFTHDTGGFSISGGEDFGFGRIGVSTGYYADHVPWGLALAGEVVAGALVVGGGGNPSGLPSPYYELRTELSVIPLTVFYEQKIPLPAHLGELRFGPVVGGTIHVASANYAQAERTDAAIGFTYGGRVAYDAYLDRRTRLRLAYEYRRMEATDYDLGFAMRLNERDTHLMTLGIHTTF